MAGFEGTRIPPLGQIAREWRPGRYAPLYLAGIALGAAAGIALTLAPSARETLPHRDVAAPAFVAPAAAPAGEAGFPGQSVHPIDGVTLPAASAVTLTPVIFEPPAPLAGAETPVVPEPVVAATIAPVVPAAADVVPVAPAVPLAPAAAAAPVAPVIPAPQPVAQQPVEQPAPAAVPSKPDFYLPAVSGGGASVIESQLFSLLNAERVNAGLAPYVLDSGLTKVARTRSQQMVDQDYFAHRDPYGYTMYTELLAQFGYTSYNWAGENLALNNYGAGETAARAAEALMASPTHRANILAGDFSRIGVGEAVTADGRHIFSMIFLG